MKIIGHRGAAALAPENSLAAIQAGLRSGVDAIEIDVRVSNDDVVVLSHDPVVRITSGPSLLITSTSYNDLVAADSNLTTLERAIQEINMVVPLMIEVKAGVPAAPIIDILQTFLERGWRADSLLIASKSQAILRLMHTALPTLPTMVIEPWSSLRAIRRARELNTTHLVMNQRFVWFGFVRAISRRYRLYVYTLNTPGKAASWERYGLAGVITDNPPAMASLKSIASSQLTATSLKQPKIGRH